VDPDDTMGREDRRPGILAEIQHWRDEGDALLICNVLPADGHALPGIAAWLTRPDDATHGRPALTPDEAIRGRWLKISAAGGLFVVKLHADYALTEHSPFDPRATWTGTWALADGRLVLRFAGWTLETRSGLRSLGGDSRAARQGGDRSSADSLEAWGVWPATERLEASLEETPFLLAHLGPGTAAWAVAPVILPEIGIAGPWSTATPRGTPVVGVAGAYVR
jgi:hypothetical protein